VRKRLLVTPLLLGLGCAPMPEMAPAPLAASAAEHSPATDAGTLRSDQITVELWDGPLLLRLVPLDEQVLRLTAPDTRQRLRAVAEAQRARLAADHPRPGDLALFLVTFQATDADRMFDPTALTLDVAGQRRWPLQVIALSPGWGQQRLQPRTPEVAVYAFDGPFSPFQPFIVRYGARASDRWRSVIPLLEAERARSAR
jgi:hypothetical protein